MAAKMDLTGQQFGKLTALRPGPPKPRRVGKRGITLTGTWVCSCECGTAEFVAQSALLRNGHQKSCGCISFVPPILGNRFGKITVVREECAGYATCVCDCDPAREFPVLGNSLRTGNTTSCGCSRRGRVLGPVTRYEFRGEQKTISEIAETLGVSTTAVRNRLKNEKPLDGPAVGRWGNVFKPFAKGDDHKNSKRYPILGRMLTRREIMALTGLTKSAILNRMARHGLTFEQAALAEVSHHEKVSVFGERLSLAELAVISGTAGRLISERMRTGMSPEEAAFGANRQAAAE